MVMECIAIFAFVRYMEIHFKLRKISYMCYVLVHTLRQKDALQRGISLSYKQNTDAIYVGIGLALTHRVVPQS